jgi:hypothetical protein
MCLSGDLFSIASYDRLAEPKLEKYKGISIKTEPLIF